MSIDATIAELDRRIARYQAARDVLLELAGERARLSDALRLSMAEEPAPEFDMVTVADTAKAAPRVVAQARPTRAAGQRGPDGQTQARILGALRLNNGVPMTTTALAAECGVTGQAIRLQLRRLMDEGLVQVLGAGATSRYRLA